MRFYPNHGSRSSNRQIPKAIHSDNNKTSDIATLRSPPFINGGGRLLRQWVCPVRAIVVAKTSQKLLKRDVDALR
jgi:hypothetical protein